MHFVRCLRRYGDVDLMCYKSHVPDQPLDTPFRKEFYIELNTDNSNSPSNTLQQLSKKFIECKPWIVNSYTDSTVKQVHSIIAEENYDIILCRYSVNAYPLLSLPEMYKKRVILDIDDLMSGELYDALNGKKSGFKKIKVFIDKIIYRKYQKRCLELGSIVFCSEQDRFIMSNKSTTVTNMYVVPNIIPNYSVNNCYKYDGKYNKNLLFVGNLAYKPNEQGIIWFINEIFKNIKEQFPDIKLTVVGRKPGDELKNLCLSDPMIELIENPPDVVPYFEQCLAVVVPLLVGGGTRIKILEAGCCRRPVITTLQGAYGLNLIEYKDLLYFENLTTFVDRLRWLNVDANYDYLVDNLAHIVESNYTESAFVRAVSTIIDNIKQTTKIDNITGVHK
ncbi:hypothetical protein GURASL_19850 [Geotalea uraniireducens]|uniref:Glycosyltransferase n=2 Tax=Geotalea uraniireducens TaxID=351604 RepID=A0ABN6VXB2_9BACT|nr:hypothetical protein GURASL_19850 [Geotalea uraniireducens]